MKKTVPKEPAPADWRKAPPAKTHDEYLGRLPADMRAALEALRQTVRSVVPEATEVFSYGLPAFKLDRPLVAYGAASGHCAIYPMSPAVIEALAPSLAAFATSKGTIRFTPEKPLPAALVKKIVKARLKELAAK